MTTAPLSCAGMPSGIDILCAFDGPHRTKATGGSLGAKIKTRTTQTSKRGRASIFSDLLLSTTTAAKKGDKHTHTWKSNEARRTLLTHANNDDFCFFCCRFREDTKKTKEKRINDLPFPPGPRGACTTPRSRGGPYS